MNVGSNYNDQFYKSLTNGSYISAKHYVSILSSVLIKPNKVVDIGCGRGPWLKAFADSGAKELVGIDGDWVCQENMLDKKIKFHSIDLSSTVIKNPVNKKFDLAMSLEVAEHLKPEQATTFVNYLTNFSETILFSAAFSGQGGTDHFNERPHSYWAKIFIKNGYLPYDLFRSKVWENQEIEVWYRQNTFLYLKSNSKFEKIFKEKGIEPIRETALMNYIHPDLYQIRVEESKQLTQLIIKLRKSTISGLIKRIMPKSIVNFLRKIRK
ncbi:Hypothetical protein P9515_04071 [Prochlorococcus marinus str. MIT 9515]|uniref:Methyltransferase domain-containing protein n=1 Tax=Prochlorococcus marinus (strain MIT 9515) TaxID=167542 RepID=A2BV05_PROM5|nr:class I SAM-dependent methyltransferase [Prochlorococcus marinus]ABM71616.1 Hypothetical protein P9515_04071 [Prochlorococcus marinus str. MIT 9515]